MSDAVHSCPIPFARKPVTDPFLRDLGIDYIDAFDLTNASRDDWLALRQSDLTASDQAAIHGVHQYKSARQLYFEKGRFPGVELPEQRETGPMRRGRRFESAVFEAVAEERPQWKIQKANVYLRAPQIRLGATPDAFILDDSRGFGALQAKTCTTAIYKRDWSEGNCPFPHVLQCLTEIMLTGAAFGAVAAIPIDAYEVYPAVIIDIERHLGSMRRIIEATKRFWDDIEHRREPEPDYNLDLDLIAALTPHEKPGKAINLAGDNEAVAAANQYCDCLAQESAIKVRKDRAKAVLMHKIGDAETVVGIPDIGVTFRTSHFKAYQVKERDTRVLRVSDRREDE